MIQWNFPPNNYGQVTGLNDAGIETFKGNPWVSLAREINQNSCDAKGDDISRPVEVHFTLEQIPVEQFPGREEFIQTLHLCSDYWKSNAKSVKFFRNALDIMNQDQIPFLKISDFNTTGLTGSMEDNRGGWHNLIKSVGSSDKGSKSGGSFGIGKHAPFACSDLRTVFYGTLDKEGVFAFQGVSKLVTHYGNNGEPTQGTGYYGQVERNKPIYNQDVLSKDFKRTVAGTDIFVAGFHWEEGWESKIIKSVLENFFLAILEQRLVVKVGGTIINSATISDLLLKHTKNDPESFSFKYHEAFTLSSRVHFYEDNFHGLGRLDLFVLPGKDMPKRVAMVRSTGMKIYDKGNFRTPFKFAGVLQAKGDLLNEFLRQIEPPTHTTWEPDRHDDPDYAKGIIKKLYAWINDKVKSISINEEAEELDVEGLSDHLPDIIGDEIGNSRVDILQEARGAGEKTAPKEIQIEVVKRRMVASVFSGIEEVTAGAEEAAGEYEKHTVDSDDNSDETPGDENEEQSSNDKKPPESKASDNEVTHSDDKNNKKPEDQGNQASKRKSLKLKHSRVFCTDATSGTYKISIMADENGLGYLGIKIVGEVGGEPAMIRTAVLEGMVEPIHVRSDGKIGPITFLKDSKCNIIITLQESLRCALEVSIHAN
ncbi:hypothetical protein [Paenibacillus anseongense]|uniref:hypothetical protein n=1 Tax=Paenibacillus anseongense TaxID=2682845 RepID=UPI002DB5CFF1|nr:hypothetical protein [Paenibacillus anseongense]MEC0269719.1 hypothetical protein [Paenibacillus anseongense]